MTKKKTNSRLNPMEALLKKKKTTVIKKNQEIEAEIVSLSKKNLVFDIGGKAYAILGRLEQKELSTYLPYLKKGDKIEVRIISSESKDGYPVVSMRKYFKKSKWKILIEKKETEEDVEVVCGNYGKGGVFIDFMGIRGVIPQIQLTEKYINNPSKLVNQKIKVRILEVDEEKNRLVVSQKSAELGLSQKDLRTKFVKIKEGKKYKAKVLSVSEFGAFCEVEGVEGLIHISEISWEKVSSATQYLRAGETVDVMVVKKNDKNFKLNLSLKRLIHDPWQGIEKKYPKDKEIEGKIIKKERYGYFVRLEAGVEGLIHVSKLKGDENLEIGKKIKVFVERVSESNRRMSLVLPQKKKPVMYR